MNNDILHIQCPNNNIEERKYIIDVLLKQFLGIDYSIIYSDTVQNYELWYDSRKVVVEDHFFAKFSDNLEYMSFSHLPQSINLLNIPLGSYPIIYGRSYFNEELDNLVCGLDIFASSFFMLTRWEEFLLGRTTTGKCKENDFFIVRNKLYKRPIVNEYCFLLSSLLQKIGINTKVSHTFNVMLTHDVDRCNLTSISVLLYNLFQLLKKRNYKKTLLVFLRYMNYKLRLTNPFDSFAELMDISERYNFRNSFYFKTCLRSEKGYTYDITEAFVKERLHTILSRGHYVGFHPSENTFYNNIQFTSEVERLQSVLSSHIIKGGRNHGLFYGNETFTQWNSAHIQYDSGYGFQFYNGFRCGCCYPFRVFDLFERKPLSLLEIPFVCMDSVVIRNHFTPNQMFEDMKQVIDEIYKYQGTVCLNFHSNIINTLEFKKYKKIYIALVEYLSKLSNSK